MLRIIYFPIGIFIFNLRIISSNWKVYFPLEIKNSVGKIYFPIEKKNSPIGSDFLRWDFFPMGRNFSNGSTCFPMGKCDWNKFSHISFFFPSKFKEHVYYLHNEYIIFVFFSNLIPYSLVYNVIHLL